jgi:hypothetical protein
MRRIIICFCAVATLAITACNGSGSSTVPTVGAPLPSPTTFGSPMPTMMPDSTASVVVDTSQTLATISKNVLGMNMAAWYDISQSGLASAMQSTGVSMLRWPGGSLSDDYHWQNGSYCGSYVNPNSTFDNLIQDVAQPAALKVAITVNYGTNIACNGPGDPAEAAAWVDYANNQKHYGVKWWTVGNEVYGSWEDDRHSLPHDPATYSSAVSSGYYPLMKAKDPSIQVGVVVGGGSAWDTYVLAHAKFDFVEDHFYAQGPGNESDSYLLNKAPAALAADLANVRAEMTAAGVPASVPIFLGELNSVYADPGKQAMSIVNGLFAGMAIAEAMKQGVPRATWWLGFGGCGIGNQSQSLYGWQTFGGYMSYSDGLPEFGCPDAPAIPRGTPFPPARAMQVLAQFAETGATMHKVTVTGGHGSVVAYGARQRSGYAVLLFNLDKASAIMPTVTIAHAQRPSYAAHSIVYGKKQYDDSKNNIWTGPVSKNLGTVSPTFVVTLPPWSMTVVTLR